LDHSAKLGFPYPVQNIMVIVPIKARLRGLQQVVIFQVPSQPPAQQAHQILWPPAQEDFMPDMLQRIQQDLFFQKRVNLGHHEKFQVEILRGVVFVEFGSGLD